MTSERSVKLAIRQENVRDIDSKQTVLFDLQENLKHFEENIASIKKHFALADELFSDERKEEAKDIWRSQIVFLESALDFYLHGISKYGMYKIFCQDWEGESFDRYQIPLQEVIKIMANPDDDGWFVELVNARIMNETFMNYDSIRRQLKVIGIDVVQVASEAFYVPQAKESPKNEMKRHLDRIHSRRNDIVHQSDRSHYDATVNQISKEYVEQEIAIIEKIVYSIDAMLCKKRSKNMQDINNRRLLIVISFMASKKSSRINMLPVVMVDLNHRYGCFYEWANKIR